MDRPRLLLVPSFTELEWEPIRPRLEEWAEIGSFDLPGVGDEPRAEKIDREIVVNRGLEEIDRRGWERCFVASDGWSAMTELIDTDHEAFIRYGIAQATGGSVSEEHAERMIERFPRDLLAVGWEAVTRDDEQIGDLLAQLDCPMLFAKHVGCLMSPEEGFDDAAASFPKAHGRSRRCPSEQREVR